MCICIYVHVYSKTMEKIYMLVIYYIIMRISINFACLIAAELVIGLQETVYTVNEGPVQVTVCAEVFEGIVERDTVVSLSTSDNTAESMPNSYIHT